jgi:hypothetical protein
MGFANHLGHDLVEFRRLAGLYIAVARRTHARISMIKFGRGKRK